MWGLRQEVQEILGSESTQISAYRHKTFRVRFLQAAFQCKDKTCKSHLYTHRRETLQMWYLWASVWWEISAEGAQMHEITRQSVEIKNCLNFILLIEIIEKFDQGKNWNWRIIERIISHKSNKITEEYYTCKFLIFSFYQKFTDYVE